ncbi:hypothetical protein OKW21_003736 [Catalinimonas alkaloidigena]|uniref:hypothetical protein n=1 Tax=Catalinimonas alkaloidigena TaxID=1075417 RepID=UPI0024058C4C|nr:hypothetical protein [Catalinimonas alkaloidigena]MDF9798473.1 hypothetical protein [Catalinimonas alkaloidigena]
MEKEQAFYKSELETVSLWGKLKGQKVEKNAVIEINNLLSEKAVMDVRADDIQEIMDKYDLNLYTDFDDGSMRELYKKYLRFCFDDNHLDSEEITRLRHLKKLLGLTDKAVEIANHQICQEVYERELDAALEDNRLDAKELQFLKQLQNKLQLPQSWVDSIYQHKAQSIIIRFVKGAIEEKRLSPDEEKELKALIDNLGIEPQLDTATQAELAKYRLFWQIENGELPSIYVPIKLKAEEYAYFLTDVQSYEERKSEKEDATTSASSLKIKLSNSNYWHPEHTSPFTAEEEQWKSIVSGKAYISSQRIILREKEKENEKSVKLSVIKNFVVYPNGLMLIRDKQKKIFLQTNAYTDVFSMILGRVLRNL